MTEPASSSILTIAEGELENVQRLLTGHRAEAHPWYGTCQSLSDHQIRCEVQVRLLTTEDAETEALF